MRGISWKGIVVGGVTDVALSTVLGIPFSIYVMASRSLTALPPDKLQSAFLDVVQNSPTLLAGQLGIGGACSILGGFIAASIAKERYLLNGVLASWLCVGLGVYSLIARPLGGPVGIHLAMIAITPVFYVLGAKIRQARAQTRSAIA